MARTIGSWRFIVCQSLVLASWIALNVVGPAHPDPYPFILLNLMLSFQAAYTGPVLLMSANRQAEVDRRRAIRNLELEEEDHERLLALMSHVDQHFDALNARLNRQGFSD